MGQSSSTDRRGVRRQEVGGESRRLQAWAVVVIQYIGEAKGQQQKFTSYKEDKFKFVVNTFFHDKLFITSR